MRGIYIVLTVLGVLFFLIALVMFLKVKVIIEASESTTVYLKILFVKIKLVPRERKKVKLRDWTSKKYRRRQEKDKLKELKKQQKKARSSEKKKKKKDEAKKKAETNSKPKKTPSEIVDLMGLVAKLAGTFFGRFSKRLQLDLTRIHITVGGEDAAKTAISYGIVCQGVNALLAVLDSITNVNPKSNRDISVDANFLSEKTEMDVELAASLRVWHVFDMLLSVAIRFVKEKFFKDYKL